MPPGRHYEFGAYRLDEQDRMPFREGEHVPLSPRVVALLLALVQAAGRVLTREQQEHNPDLIELTREPSLQISSAGGQVPTTGVARRLGGLIDRKAPAAARLAERAGWTTIASKFGSTWPLPPGSAGTHVDVGGSTQHEVVNCLEHLTPDEVGMMAARAHVKAVILYHVAAEYDEKNLAAMQAGVQRWFHGQLVLGNDFTAFDMSNGQYAVDYAAVPQ